jgi:hypothetical protein
VLTALQLDADHLPVRSACGDREVLRMLLAARYDLTVDGTVRTGPLGALLRDGEDARPSARPGVCNENTSIGLARAACTARSRWPCATAEERS